MGGEIEFHTTPFSDGLFMVTFNTGPLQTICHGKLKLTSKPLRSRNPINGQNTGSCSISCLVRF